MVNNSDGRPRIGITLGDPAGIGPEIAIKALSHNEVYEECVPVLIGDTLVIEDALKVTHKTFTLNKISAPEDAQGRPGTVDYFPCGIISQKGDYAFGALGLKSGEAAFQYVVKGIDLAMKGEIAAVVTNPINKEAIHLAGHEFAGHTEIFAHYTNTEDYGMLLSAGGSTGLNVIHVTTHVSMRRACDLITEKRVLAVIRLAGEALTLMGKEKRRIAVAGLNAHASENGLFGKEEEESIIPAIKKARAEGLDVTGPVPPDTVFVKALGGAFDIVVAMYHDQGHIPLKLCGFKMDPATGLFSQVSGINTTIGLPIIRTSVDHGTAFDKAGKNEANEESLLDAIAMAVTIANNRRKG
ncbi:4-hydroxythreonine-4-phosphate dehydrogenase PdxA [Leadbettera azotonutricia]|uniref:4-hydroxythreonine-4-phosphate dehydrogenase n=1 Tax=Leadbettera azotonutricia (strain ATCC BAA-888 / DSM 13862 / ZAS-9) TaxID=545695 RepID=F5Y6T1_LEAAZ|nr:4-hydroxythreonine-4-phosphate dehydrogenase PdxA [Leadbettera azotonutricia]AEF83342.1 4-hydroxythreonine-4-phosphate dehydrogenase [Leadbettera azotonutricia ZAS-9]